MSFLHSSFSLGIHLQWNFLGIEKRNEEKNNLELNSPLNSFVIWRFYPFVMVGLQKENIRYFL